jgi:hypothetical protein
MQEEKVKKRHMSAELGECADMANGHACDEISSHLPWHFND